MSPAPSSSGPDNLARATPIPRIDSNPTVSKASHRQTATVAGSTRRVSMTRDSTVALHGNPSLTGESIPGDGECAAKAGKAAQ
jgi:hypothetical protein